MEISLYRFSSIDEINKNVFSLLKIFINRVRGSKWALERYAHVRVKQLDGLVVWKSYNDAATAEKFEAIT